MGAVGNRRLLVRRNILLASMRVPENYPERAMPFHRRLLDNMIVAAACAWTVCAPALVVAADQDLTASARLLVAARSSDSAAVERALKEGATPNARNRLGETALVI